MEELGLLTFVADNGDVLINLFGFLAVEPAKLAIPVVSYNSPGSHEFFLAILQPGQGNVQPVFSGDYMAG